MPLQPPVVVERNNHLRLNRMCSLNRFILSLSRLHLWATAVARDVSTPDIRASIPLTVPRNYGIWGATHGDSA